MPIWKRAGLGLLLVDQLPDRVHRDVDVADQRGRHQRDQRDRREVLERIVGELAVEERVHHQRAVDRHQQRVAVGAGLGDRLRADDGVGAGAVVDDDLLAEVLAHLLADQPAEEIGRPARRERHDQRDLARRIGLRHERPAAEEQQRGDGADRDGRGVPRTFFMFVVSVSCRCCISRRAAASPAAARAVRAAASCSPTAPPGCC